MDVGAAVQSARGARTKRWEERSDRSEDACGLCHDASMENGGPLRHSSHPASKAAADLHNAVLVAKLCLASISIAQF